MVSDPQDESPQAAQALAEFLKILIKEYPQAFTNDSSTIDLNPYPTFPYKATLTINKHSEDPEPK